MSHFTVLVIGDVEKSLAPYHEFECTGVDDEYVQDIDETENMLEKFKNDSPGVSFLEYCKSNYGMNSIPHGDIPDITGLHKFGYITTERCNLTNETLVKSVIRRTNPNGYWDWYTIGGRWSDYFLLKGGTRANSAKKWEIDFRGMSEEVIKRETIKYKSIHDIIAGRKWITWDEFKSIGGDLNIAGSIYRSQDVIRDLNDAGHYISFDSFRETLSDYVHNRVRESMVPFAYILDGVWYSRGTMGWFGAHVDNKTVGDWYDQVFAMLAAVRETETITLVDCHI